MKRLLICLMLLAGGIFGYSMLASACDVDCSPGYYKNHWEVVVDAGCADGIVRTDLAAEEGATKEMRETAKAALDACFEDLGYSPCDDD